MSLLLGFFIQYWSTPVNLGISGVDDINPQTCRLQVPQNCLVWQAYVNGNWEIYARFDWGDTLRVTNDTASDINPSVAYDYSQNCFWCVWQNNSSGNWDIYVAKGNTISGWQGPYQLTTDPGPQESPSVCVIGDTVWVVWHGSPAAEAVNIWSSYYDGTGWSVPAMVSFDSVINNLHPKINARYNHPFVVWEKNGDIYYNEYIADAWQTPQPITTAPANDSMPEISTESFFGYTYGVWVFWQSNRDGNWEIYRTGYDSLSSNYRFTYNDSSDVTPSPLFFLIPIKEDEPQVTAFSTNRNGNFDIYASLLGSTAAVDINPAQDVLPVTTANGATCVWVVWQTDRNGDWDIYGSYRFFGEIGESASGGLKTEGIKLAVYPNPFSQSIRFTIHDARYRIQENQMQDARSNPSATLGTGKQDFSLKIYDATGRLIRQWDYQSALGGMRLSDEIVWSGDDDLGRTVPPGVYFICIPGERIKAIKL